MAGNRGRPSKYTKDLGDKICAELAKGRTLSSICDAEGMPCKSAVLKWALDDKHEFYEQYARARLVGYHAMADEILDVVDDGRNDWMTIKKNGEEVEVVNREVVERSKLRFQARQWLLSKAMPKVYGDKLDISGKVDASDAFKKMWEALGNGALQK